MITWNACLAEKKNNDISVDMEQNEKLGVYSARYLDF